MPTVLRRLGSVRLAVALLLVLAAAAALGTWLPQNLDPGEFLRRFPRAGPLLLTLGFDRFFQSPLYRGLLALFTLNLLACAAGRSRRGWLAFRGRARPTVRVPGPAAPDLAERLRAAGFRIRTASPLRASRRPWAFLGFPLVHLSLPVIFAGALWGSLAGFVGTQTVHVGDEMRAFYDWSAGRDRPLPFRLRVAEFRELHYPTPLRIRLGLPGRVAREVVTREGARIEVPDSPYTVRLGRFDRETKDLTFWVEGPGGTLGPFSRDRRQGCPVDFTPLGFRDPEVRRVEARVEVLAPDGTPTRTAVIAVNEPLVHGGLRIFLTAWGADPYGFPWVGFQITRDPGQPAVWLGSAGLVAGLALLWAGRGAWVWEEEGEVRAVATGRMAAELRARLTASGGGADDREVAP
ncbi:cytochrome c biogenesis protein ResB [Deferrisoma palaeochoriense]